MRSTVSWIYAVIAVLLVTLVIIAVWLAFKTGFITNSIAIIRTYANIDCFIFRQC